MFDFVKASGPQSLPPPGAGILAISLEYKSYDCFCTKNIVKINYIKRKNEEFSSI